MEWVQFYVARRTPETYGFDPAKPWYVIRMRVDEMRERVHHRLVSNGFATKAEAEEYLKHLESLSE